LIELPRPSGSNPFKKNMQLLRRGVRNGERGGLVNRACRGWGGFISETESVLTIERLRRKNFTFLPSFTKLDLEKSIYKHHKDATPSQG
jgi:hypothetical protein